MQCSLCGTPGTTFTKAVHPRHGVVYLCDACRVRAQQDLRPIRPAPVTPTSTSITEMIMTPHAFFPTPPGRVAALALIVLAAVLMAGCTSQTGPVVSIVTPAPASASASTLPAGVTVTKLEVLHFHPTRGCATCTAIGEYANATVTKYFANELASGKVVFRHINIDLAENRAVVEQYKVTGSSLMFGVYTSDGTFYPEENIKVWYRTDDQQRFMDYLKGVIEKRLSGDLSPA